MSQILSWDLRTFNVSLVSWWIYSWRRVSRGPQRSKPKVGRLHSLATTWLGLPRLGLERHWHFFCQQSCTSWLKPRPTIRFVWFLHQPGNWLCKYMSNFKSSQSDRSCMPPASTEDRIDISKRISCVETPRSWLLVLVVWLIYLIRVAPLLNQ